MRWCLKIWPPGEVIYLLYPKIGLESWSMSSPKMRRTDFQSMVTTCNYHEPTSTTVYIYIYPPNLYPCRWIMMLRKPRTSFRDDNFGAGTNIKDAWPGSKKHRFLKYMVDEWLMSPHTISSYMLGPKKRLPVYYLLTSDWTTMNHALKFQRRHQAENKKKTTNKKSKTHKKK